MWLTSSFEMALFGMERDREKTFRHILILCRFWLEFKIKYILKTSKRRI